MAQKRVLTLGDELFITLSLSLDELRKLPAKVGNPAHPDSAIFLKDYSLGICGSVANVELFKRISQS